jgi:predicted nucleic acid-binding Zn ribbon protein
MSASKNSYTYETLVESLKTKNITLITKDFENKNFIKRGITVNVICDNCKQENVCTIHNLMLRDCKNCKLGMPNYKIIQELIEDENYELLSTFQEFCSNGGNNKTEFNYICDNGHKNSGKLQHWKRGARCKDCASKKMKKNINKVIEIYKGKGFELLDNKYIDNKTPLKCKCSCGEIAFIALSNMRDNRVGCNKCYESRKGYLWQDRQLIFEKEDCKIICSEKEFIKTGIIKYICICGKEDSITWKSFQNGVRCKDCGIESRKETNIEKYGAENVSQTQYFKDKSKETNMKNCGFPHNMMDEKCKQKAKKTNLDNHEGIYNLNLPETRKLAHDKCDELYEGKCYPTSKHGQEKCREKHGRPFAMQVPEIFEKAQKSGFRLKYLELPSGKVISYQGYEHFAIQLLLDYEFEEEDIITGCKFVPQIDYKYKGKNKTYYPDIYIQSANLLIEVKSKHTLEDNASLNQAKFMATARDSRDFKFLLLVFDGKGNLEVKKTYWCDRETNKVYSAVMDNDDPELYYV